MESSKSSLVNSVWAHMTGHPESRAWNQEVADCFQKRDRSAKDSCRSDAEVVDSIALGD